MTAFDNREFEKYKSEVKEKWGKTDAYKEHADTPQEIIDSFVGLMFDKFANIYIS